MRALRDMNLPKFVFEDVPLFLGLISDLFPGLDCPRVRYPKFNDAVEQALEEAGYIVLPIQVFKDGKHCKKKVWQDLLGEGVSVKGCLRTSSSLMQVLSPCLQHVCFVVIELYYLFS